MRPVGVIGGSGLYSLLDDPEPAEIETPYGAPSAAVATGSIGDTTVAFLPRHGTRHEFPPHRINYRANLWALRSLGVREVLAPCAVGSLDPGVGPGRFVVPDQLLDRTTGRDRTFFDTAVHVPFADPYCARGRAAVLSAAGRLGLEPVAEATLVVIDGPRFSTRAESRANAAAGGRIVGMTGMPEAVLARELGLCYTAIALVTDHDAGVEAGSGVTQQEVFEVFAARLDDLRRLLFESVAGLGADDCECRHALDGIEGVEVP